MLSRGSLLSGLFGKKLPRSEAGAGRRASGRGARQGSVSQTESPIIGGFANLIWCLTGHPTPRCGIPVTGQFGTV